MRSGQTLGEVLDAFLRERGRPSYRIVVVDERERPEGLVTGRRMLEALMGLRGGPARRASEVLEAPVEIVMDELRSVLPADAPLEAAIDLLAESAESVVVLVDYQGRLVGVVDPACVLERLSIERRDIKVRDAATEGAVSVDERASLREAAEVMVLRRVRRVVVTRGEKVVGVLAVRDLARLFRERLGREVLDELRAADAMTPNPLVASPEEPLEAAIERMVVHGVSALPVVDEERRPLGVLSRIDVIRALVRRMGARRLAEALVPAP